MGQRKNEPSNFVLIYSKISHKKLLEMIAESK